MPGEQADGFVAPGSHEPSPVSALQAILDRYDHRRAERERGQPVEAVPGGDRDRFALDFSAWREDGLRAALEEVAWHLEQRGHHAWLDDVGGDEEPAASETARERAPTVRPLVLVVVPAEAERLDADAASQLRVVPDGETCRVRIEAVLGAAGGAAPVTMVPARPLQALTEQFVIDTATLFVREVLLGGDRVDAERPPEDQIPARRLTGSPSVDVGHEWSDTGITKKWLEQQRQTRRTEDPTTG
jgi:hypothetical protein